MAALTARDAAAVYGVSERTARRWLAVAARRGVEAGEYPVALIDVPAGRGARRRTRVLLVPDAVVGV